jgi:hypothetical protein
MIRVGGVLLGFLFQEFVSGEPKDYEFSVFCPSAGKYNKMQRKVYKLELRKFTGCELHNLRDMIL